MNKQKLIETIQQVSAIAPNHETIGLEVEPGANIQSCRVFIETRHCIFDSYFIVQYTPEFNGVFNIAELMGYLNTVKGNSVTFLMSPCPDGNHKILAKTEIKKDSRRRFDWDIAEERIYNDGQYQGKVTIPKTFFSALKPDQENVIGIDENLLVVNGVEYEIDGDRFTREWVVPGEVAAIVKSFKSDQVTIRAYTTTMMFQPDYYGDKEDMGINAIVRDMNSPIESRLLQAA